MSSQIPPQTDAEGSTAVAGPADGEALAPPATTESERHGWASYARFISVAIAGVTLDLWSKDWAFETLEQNGRRVLIPYVLEFQTMLNAGALFGIGRGRTTLFLIASCCALVLVFWMFMQCSRRRWLLHIALGAILAGAFGNMYDRAFVRMLHKPVRSNGAWIYVEPVRVEGDRLLVSEYPPTPERRLLPLPNDEPHEVVGFVRDFIKIPTKLWGEQDLWPWVFNVADMLLVGGVMIVALYLWRDRKPPAGVADDPVDSEASAA